PIVGRAISRLALSLSTAAFMRAAGAQSARRDGVGALLKGTPEAGVQVAHSKPAAQPRAASAPAPAPSVARPPRDPRRGAPGSVQKKIEGLRKNMRELDDRIVKLREKQIVAPKDGMLPGLITDTVDSLSKDIDESKKKIELNKDEIKKAKGEIQAALGKAGVQ